MGFSNNELIIVLAIFIPIALIQGTWVFYDARKRKEKCYWIWGVFALLNTPGNLLLYLLVTRVILNNKNKGSS